MSLLAILDLGNCYGYQLRAEFERRTMSIWPLNVGQVYSTLDRLERIESVQRTTTDDDGHAFYAITPKGRAEVAEWLASPLARSNAPRDELAIKLAVAATLPDVDIGEVIRVQRTATLRHLQYLTRSKNATTDPESADELAGQLVIDSLIFHTEAEVKWLDHSEIRLNRAAAMKLPLSTPLSADLPGRGRPVGRR